MGSNGQAWGIGIGVALLVVALGGLLVRSTVQGLPPGTTLAGEPVSDPADAALLAEQLASRVATLPVTVRTAAGSVVTSAGTLGAGVDVARISRTARDEAGFDDWVGRLTGGAPVVVPLDLLFTAGDADALAQELSTPPVDGDIDITAAGLAVTDAVVGVDVTPDMVGEAFRRAATTLESLPLAQWPDNLEVSLEAATIQPAITQRSVDAAVARIGSMTTGPVRLEAETVPEDAQTVDGQGVPHRETISLMLSGDELVQLLDVEPDPDNIERERLQVVARDDSPPPSLVAFLERAAVGPDMAISVEDRSPTPTRVSVDPADVGPGGPADNPAYHDVATVSGRLEARLVEPGLDPSLSDTVDAIVDGLLAGSEEVEVLGEEVTDLDPADLGIIAPVSTYTTFYEPGQPRVTNIHLIAELVDGALIPPGGNYDLNHAAGERTAAGGFVSAGAILEGEFISDIGGGVSQFGTTFFNAMWFAGLDIITHTPHSFFFDRYPAGREATIDYPGVDLELNNNTPYWVLVDTAVTDDSVTVTLWSTPWFEVETVMGQREATEKGFRIRVERTASAPDGTVDDDSFLVDYKLA